MSSIYTANIDVYCLCVKEFVCGVVGLRRHRRQRCARLIECK